MIFIFFGALIGAIVGAICSNLSVPIVCMIILISVTYWIYLNVNKIVYPFEDSVSKPKVEIKGTVPIASVTAFDTNPKNCFVIEKKDFFYYSYVRTEMGYMKSSFPIHQTKLKNCNGEFTEPCVVIAQMIETHKPICKYKKALYNGILFFYSPNQPETTQFATTYTLYIPKDSIVE